MTARFLNRLIQYFQGSFDITRPFSLGDDTFDAMAVFHAHVDKYVLVKKAQLWAMDSHEYCLMNTYEEGITVEDVNRCCKVLTDYFEPHFVRNDETLPSKDHMYSYVTAILICNCPIPKEVIKQVRHYKFTKYYQMYIRGYSEAHVILVDTLTSKIYTNSAGKSKLKLCKSVFKDLKSGKE